MSAEIYRIKPLEWSDSEAISIVGTYQIVDLTGFLGEPRYEVRLRDSSDDDGALISLGHASWGDAAIAATADYKERIYSAIEFV